MVFMDLALEWLHLYSGCSSLILRSLLILIWVVTLATTSWPSSLFGCFTARLYTLDILVSAQGTLTLSSSFWDAEQ